MKLTAGSPRTPSIHRRLLEWERKKRDIDQGRVSPFDVEAWEIHVQLIRDETARRKVRRREKRRRMALRSPSPDSGLSSEAGQSGAAPSIGIKRKFSAASVASGQASALFVTPEDSRSPALVILSAQEPAFSSVFSSSSDKPLVEERPRPVSNAGPAAQLPTSKPPIAPPEKSPLVGFGMGNKHNKRAKPNI